VEEGAIVIDSIETIGFPDITRMAKKLKRVSGELIRLECNDRIHGARSSQERKHQVI